MLKTEARTGKIHKDELLKRGAQQAIIGLEHDLPAIITDMDTRIAPNGATIGQITTDVKDLNRLGKDLDQKLIKDGAIHIEMPGKKMPGKKTPGKQTAWQVNGTLTQAPLDQDGMQEKVGLATMPHATRQLKEITQQRVLHIKMST